MNFNLSAAYAPTLPQLSCQILSFEVGVTLEHL